MERLDTEPLKSPYPLLGNEICIKNLTRHSKDSHVHLQDYEDSVQDQIIKESIESGVKYLICNSTSERDFSSVIELSKKFKDVVIPCFGIHPW